MARKHKHVAFDVPARPSDADQDQEEESASDKPLLPVHEPKRHAEETEKAANQRRKVLTIVGIVGVLLLCVHLIFVLLLRETTVTLRRLTVPDLCHAQSSGDIVVDFHNPSYCSPHVDKIALTISKNDTELLQLSLPGFELQAGKFTHFSTVAFDLLTTPQVVNDLIFHTDSDFEVAGAAVVHISCLIYPVTMTLSMHDFPIQKLREVENGTNTKEDMFAKELDRLITQIFKSIALSHITTEDFDKELFAFTDVTFNYIASVVWNVPSLAIKLESADHDRILSAGFTRFLLGNGDTHISVFSEIYKNETEPMQDMLQSYLAGHDMRLHVRGDNAGSTCLSLQLLDLADFDINVPARIDGKPALVRQHIVKPTLKQLDSRTHKCLLELNVVLTLNNPLPIHFTLFELAFDLSYHDRNDSVPTSTFLKRIDDERVVSWAAHEVHNISFATEIRTFDTCKNLIEVYFKDHLGFSLERGHIKMAAGNGNFSIPFHVPDIPIHPSTFNGAFEYEALT